MRKFVYIFVAVFIVFGCIDPVKFNFDQQVEHVAIQAAFTTKTGKQSIRVSKSNSFGSPYNQFITNATVYISSLEGEKINFAHIASGKYESLPNIKAIDGHTYTLHVEFNGLKYESEPVKLADVVDKVPIDKINLVANSQFARILGKKTKQFGPGYSIKVDFKDPGAKKNFYRWSYSFVYGVMTYPEDYVDYSCRGCPRPAPKDCCKFCYVYENDELLSTANDWLRDGQMIKNEEVMFIPFYQFMNLKLRLTIFQHVIDEKAYNYFRALNAQAESSGSMFDAPPTELKGNIRNTANPDEKVIGYFEASSVTEKTIEILGTQIKEKFPLFDFPDDCRVIPGATTVKPTNW